MAPVPFPRRWRSPLVALPLLAFPSSYAPPSVTQTSVHLLSVDGVVGPPAARYLSRGLDDAASEGAALVVVRLNTPGGLESSMREMAEALLGSTVPVVVYVSPAGARAASAGMFLTLAANVAAMAPGTNIGAAHPVGIGGDVEEAAAEKVAQDAAALARSLADARGRNGDWAARAVLESVSVTAEEALRLGVVDMIAASLEELLAALDGREVTMPAGTVTLHTDAARLVERPMTFAERVLQTITDPNVAYILFTIGLIGIIAELYNPGALFPGVTGAISLVLAFVAFGSLPINWAGVLLILLAIGLFIGELYTEGIGVLAGAGLVAFVLGSLMLYSPISPASPAMPDARVSPWLVGGMATAIGAFFIFVLRSVLRMRRSPAVSGAQALVGRTGVAVSDVAPLGQVQIDTEVWSAVAESGTIRAGEEAEVVGVEGVRVRVRGVGRRPPGLRAEGRGPGTEGRGLRTGD